MAKYGTILMLYDSIDADFVSVKTILDGHEIPFLRKENTYYFKTLSKRNRDEISSQLNGVDLTFVLFHNNNSDGDKIKRGNISNDDLKEIKEHLIKE